MALTSRLLVSAQALGAVIAYLRLEASGEKAEPALQERIEQVIDQLGAREALDALTEQERNVVISFARSYLHQMIELVEDPSRPGAWSHSDPLVLQAQGAASALVAKLFSQAGLGTPEMRILDVGTGVAGLAIAFCQEFPGATVVGIDPWEPSLSLARSNVANAALGDRITLHALPIQEFEDAEGFDLIWLPSFFIPEHVVDEAFRRARGLLRAKGSLVVAITHGPEDPLAGAVDAMTTIRSGGAVLTSEETIERLRRAGVTDVGEAERTWRAPLQLMIATREDAAA